MMLIPILSSSHHQLDAGQGNASHSQRQRHSTTGEGFRSSTKPHAAPPRKSSHLIEHSSMDATAISNLVFANLSEAGNYVSLPEVSLLKSHFIPTSPSGYPLLPLGKHPSQKDDLDLHAGLIVLPVTSMGAQWGRRAPTMEKPS